MAIGPLNLKSDHFLSGVFTTSTAIRDGEVTLNFRKCAGTAVDHFANLTITDAVAETDVHGSSGLKTRLSEI